MALFREIYQAVEVPGVGFNDFVEEAGRNRSTQVPHPALPVGVLLVTVLTRRRGCITRYGFSQAPRPVVLCFCFVFFCTVSQSDTVLLIAYSYVDT